jgi:integrase
MLGYEFTPKFGYKSTVVLPAEITDKPVLLASLQGPFGVANGLLSGPFDIELAEQHTLDHRDCPACMAADAALQAQDSDVALMLFKDAARWWMRLRRQSASLRGGTHESTQGYLNALEKFFGNLRLCDIRPGHIRAYQIARLQNRVRVGDQEVHPWLRNAGHSYVNHEISVLGQMLTHCKLWHLIRPFYFPLPTNSWSPREILSEAEEDQMFKRLENRPEARLAYWVAAITNNTTAAGCELRGLRLRHVFLRNGKDRDGNELISEIYIPEEAVKNGHRPRKIALNPTAKWAVEQCYKRALELGAYDPDHFLFPFRRKAPRRIYDPERPAGKTFLRKSWEKLRTITGFVNLNPHDLRHHCITRLLENGVEPETVTAIAGHRPNSKMLEYYAHHRTRVKYAAVMAIEKKPARKPAKPLATSLRSAS